MVLSYSVRRFTSEQTFPDAADDKMAVPGIVL